MTTYIGHACSDIDHKAGDSSGEEVKTSKLSYSSSSTSWQNWTYIIRPKDKAKALKAADMCEQAIKNNNIGYVKNSSKAYGSNSITRLVGAVKYNLAKINKKTGLSCGDLVSLCYHYAGISTFYEGTALGFLKKAKATGKFTVYKYKSGFAKRGDAIITAHSNGKHNHVVMCLGSTYSGTYPTLPSRKYFKKGDKGENVKRLQSLLNWLVGAGLKIDGEIGPLTVNAVIKFQKAYGLTADGQFGAKSLAKAKEIKR